MPKATPPKPYAAAEAVRFSAPSNIGPPLPGVEPGSALEVEGPTPNAGRYIVQNVDADWMTITERVIEDHAGGEGVKVSLVKGATE